MKSHTLVLIALFITNTSFAMSEPDRQLEKTSTKGEESNHFLSKDFSLEVSNQLNLKDKVQSLSPTIKYRWLKAEDLSSNLFFSYDANTGFNLGADFRYYLWKNRSTAFYLQQSLSHAGDDLTLGETAIGLEYKLTSSWSLIASLSSSKYSLPGSSFESRYVASPIVLIGIKYSF